MGNPEEWRSRREQLLCAGLLGRAAKGLSLSSRKDGSLEKYTHLHGQVLAFELARTLKWDPGSRFVLLPVFLGLAPKIGLGEIYKEILQQLPKREDQAFFLEEVLNQWYERAANKVAKLEILSHLDAYADMKIKGYPGKLWSLYLWRLGSKYLDIDEPEQVLRILKKLRGKNKGHLQKAYAEKYGKPN